jgi:hypothetical protein
MDDTFDPLRVLISAFALAAIGGLASLFRGKAEITYRTSAAAMLYSGLSGLTIALIWYNKYQSEGNIYFLLGVSVLVGLGGVSVADLAMQVMRHGGFNLSIGSKEKDKEPKGDKPGEPL